MSAARTAQSALAFVREVYPRLLAWHRWFFRERDPQGEGLVCVIHPWEWGWIIRRAGTRRWGGWT